MAVGGDSVDHSARPEAGWYPNPTGSGVRWWTGSEWSSDDTPGGVSETSSLPPAQREVLRAYQEHVELRCLECGYRGPMGLVGRKHPVWVWGLGAIMAPISLSLGTSGAGLEGFVVGMVWLLILLGNAKTVADCPVCRNHLNA